MMGQRLSGKTLDCIHLIRIGWEILEIKMELQLILQI